MYVTLFIGIIILYNIYYMRYNNIRRLILNLLTDSKKVIFLDDIKNIELIDLILKNSKIKGKGLEYYFALPAWYPIYNVESVDGELWIQLKTQVQRIIPKIKNDNLIYLTKKYTKKIFDEQTIVCAKYFSLLPAYIFYELLFDECLNDETAELFYKASIEWRKEISIKGKACSKIKMQFYNFFQRKLETTDRIVISAYAQPFFISPMINFNDIFASISDIPKHMISNTNIIPIIMESIRLQHPFPILERELEQDLYYDRFYPKGTHIYIELDKFIQDPIFNINKWINMEYCIYSNLIFGTGPRRCIGKQLALTMLSNIIDTINKNDGYKDKCYPTIGYKYSGRKNDNTTDLPEIIYQIKLFIKLLVHKITSH